MENLKVVSEPVTEEQAENAVAVNGHYMPVREYHGERVVTFKDIDTAHERPVGTAGRNFRTNRKYFIEGVDFFKISPDEFRRAFGGMDKRQQNDILLFTETGYYMLVKSFTDELSWTVQRELVNNYFRVKKTEQPVQYFTDPKILEILAHIQNIFEFAYKSMMNIKCQVDNIENRQKLLETRITKNQFIPPTVEEVEEYCDRIGEYIDAERFVDYYSSVGWVIGNGKPMKDWKASVRCWFRY